MSLTLQIRQIRRLNTCLYTLKMLGCIPRTPSPEPEPNAVTISDDAREARVRALLVSIIPSVPIGQDSDSTQTELALLEGGVNLKREGLGVGSGIKRELENSKNVPPRKRSRQSGAIETIDLTDDQRA